MTTTEAPVTLATIEELVLAMNTGSEAPYTVEVVTTYRQSRKTSTTALDTTPFEVKSYVEATVLFAHKGEKKRIGRLYLTEQGLIDRVFIDPDAVMRDIPNALLDLWRKQR